MLLDIRDNFLHRGFCTAETRIWARILLHEFWTPEFRTRILGSNFWSYFFQEKRPLKNSPSRNSPPKIHFPKFNPEIGPKNSHCTSAGPLGWFDTNQQRACEILGGEDEHLEAEGSNREFSWSGLFDPKLKIGPRWDFLRVVCLQNEVGMSLRHFLIYVELSHDLFSLVSFSTAICDSIAAITLAR